MLPFRWISFYPEARRKIKQKEKSLEKDIRSKRYIEMIKEAYLWIFHLYYDGFKSMRIGKKLWLLIVIKLFILIVIVKYFLFPNVLKENFQNDQQRSAYILQQLTFKKGD